MWYRYEWGFGFYYEIQAIRNGVQSAKGFSTLGFKAGKPRNRHVFTDLIGILI